MAIDTSHTPVSRRALARGAAWAIPTAVISTAAPALATSLRKDPGINGWVLNTYSAGRCGRSNTTIDVTSIASSATPDGAPFGLYLYDTERDDRISDASLTYWVLGEHGTGLRDSTRITWSAANGHASDCWSGPVRVAPAVKADGLTYTGYRWTYTCAIDAANPVTGADGVERVMLKNFHVSTNAFQQPTGSCGKLNFWAERSITINDEVHTFERRNGTDGLFTPRARSARSAEPASEGSGDEEQTATC